MMPLPSLSHAVFPIHCRRSEIKDLVSPFSTLIVSNSICEPGLPLPPIAPDERVFPSGDQAGPN
jgi:hypothetical protein